MRTSGKMASHRLRGLRRGVRRNVFMLVGSLALVVLMAACGTGGVSTATSTSTSTSTSDTITVPVQVKVGPSGSTVILLPVKIQGQGPYVFALDTGAATTLVDSNLANKLGLQQVGQPQQIGGVTSNEKAVPIKISNWSIEKLNLPSVTGASASLGNASPTQSTGGLQGLVGSDVWNKFGTVVINYAKQTITVPREFASNGTSTGVNPSNTSINSAISGGVTVKVVVHTGSNGSTIILVPVKIQGQGPYVFALDTGASISLIDQPIAQRLNLKQVGQAQTINGVASGEKAIPVQVNKWSIENLNLPQTTVASASLFSSQRGQGLQGLVGSDVWRQFGTLIINYNAQTITVPKSF